MPHQVGCVARCLLRRANRMLDFRGDTCRGVDGPLAQLCEPKPHQPERRSDGRVERLRLRLCLRLRRRDDNRSAMTVTSDNNGMERLEPSPVDVLFAGENLADVMERLLRRL